ncbi:MAG TPA: sterol desaturase family protein [Magnetospirillaceae bacterium]|jgi:sterol desaturase/sphingolipid hydroxylase (fatty acid hydroxylase superfamily)
MSLGAILSWSPLVVTILATLEGLVLTFIAKRAYNWKSYLSALTDFMVREHIVYPYLAIGLARPLIGFAWQHRLTTIPLDGLTSFAVVFLGQEFCYYWFHRAAHRMRWFWSNHAVHHASNEFNWGISYRFGWAGRLIGDSLFYVPLIWIGFSPQAVFLTLTLNLLYQFWIHNEWTPKLGWFEYVFNMPSHHRVHHASNTEYLDRNYGGVLIVFDRLFGTYAEERADNPCRYGLTTPLLTYNPVKIAFHEFIKVGRDLTGARSIRDVLGYLFGPPGWKPRRVEDVVNAEPEGLSLGG